MNVDLKVATALFIQKLCFSEQPKKSPNTFAAFETKLFANYYQKSANLFTLVVSYLKDLHHFSHKDSQICLNIKQWIPNIQASINTVLNMTINLPLQPNYFNTFRPIV